MIQWDMSMNINIVWNRNLQILKYLYFQFSY